MRVVVHAGMHKTGSSSIQQTFVAHEVPGWYYPALTPTGNHSRVWITLFEDEPERTPANALAGLTAAELARRGARWRAELGEELAAGDRHLLISAERVSKTSPVAAARARDWLGRWFPDITLIAYVRPPVSFMASAFQQVVNARGEDRIGGRGFWPEYRERFEKLDAVFGRENVRLKLYDPTTLLGGDVVLDLARELGVALSPEQVVRANESVSLEATALVFVQRRWGHGFVGGFRGAPRMNNDFVASLSQIGSSKLAFSPELVGPWLEENRSDVEWIEERLGCAVLDAPPTSGRLVSSEDDLLEIALENAEEVASLVGDERSTDGDARTRLVSDLETLRERHYAVG